MKKIGQVYDYKIQFILLPKIKKYKLFIRMKSIEERIIANNSKLLPNMVALKYQSLRASEFNFFRGTAHLFYEDLPPYLPLLASPNVWVCGDLHLANFGSYRGDNLLAYFDINDFDEATLAPALFDVARFMVSLFVAADSLGFDKKNAQKLSEKFLESYIKTLSEGYVRHFEQATATGLMKTFLNKVKEKSHEKFLASRVEDGKKLVLKPKKMIELSKEARLPIVTAFEKWAEQTEKPDFYKVKDIAFRISGTGSLGIERYIALVQGEKDTKADVLIDIKESLPSVVERVLAPPSRVVGMPAQYPAFKNNASRAVELQKRIQAIPPALLSTFTFNDKSFIVRELQPTSDKIDFSLYQENHSNFLDILDKMAKILAWGQLRSSGRQGSATTDMLMSFAENAGSWQLALMGFVEQYADKVKADYKDYCVAFDKKAFNTEGR
jgi:uncharacterized protein (DUF2252 family)